MHIPFFPFARPLAPKVASLVLALAAAGLAATFSVGARAAHFELVGGSISGSLLAQADAGGTAPISFGGAIDDLSGTDTLLGLGGGDLTQALGAGSSTHTWAREAQLALQPDPSSLSFLAGGSTGWAFNAPGALAGAWESAGLSLQGSLRIAADGEALGTLVRLTLQGQATHLFSSTLAGATDLPSLDLQILDADSQVLAGWQGLAMGGNDSFTTQFTARVGDVLGFQLTSQNQLLVEAQDLSGLNAGLDATTQLSGTLAVTAVPEPQTWALLASGLLAVGTLARRRQ